MLDVAQDRPVEGTRGRRGLPIRTLVGRFAVLPLCAISIAAHVTYGSEDFGVTARICAGLLSSLALVVLAWAPVRVMPAIAIGIGYFYFALGAPVFSRAAMRTTAGRLRLSAESLDLASLAALLFGLVAVAVALLTDRAIRRGAWTFTRRLDGTGSFTATDVTVARAFAGVSFAFRIAQAINIPFGSFAQPVYLIASPIISLTLLYWNAERTGERFDRYIYWIAVASLAGLGMLGGMLGEVLTPGIVAGSLMWASRARLPIGMLSIGVVLLLFLNPVKGTYRNLTWFGREHRVTLVDRITLWGVAIERTYGTGRSEMDQDVNSSVNSTMSRMGTLSQVGQIFEWVPNRVPFAGAEQWLALPSLAIPRVLWPEKPSIDQFFNRTYTHRFKLQNRQSIGSVTLPSVGDGYWRLGWLGVVLEASLLGVILGAAQGISRGGSRSALLLAGSLIQLRTDSQIINSLTGTLQQLFVGLLVAWLASTLARLFLDAPSTSSVPEPTPLEELL